MYIESADGSFVYGYAVAGDTGGKIKGNRIDLYMDTRSECLNFGVRNLKVYILE
jgi:3D (Asp-Asp-Asp) domain-containing protein